ncbi:MAG: hypothetical protein RIQ89_978 [Bacteroidota bacterium]|jgi:predicted O-methyltransferase YrrM
MQQLINSTIQNYCEAHTTPPNYVLENLEIETYKKVLMPHMISGSYQGRVLSFFSNMIGPKKILEIGTFTGYASICLAEGLQEGGTITTIEINDELKELAQSHISQLGWNNRVNLLFGNALDIIPQLKETFDLVFIDADKINYKNYYELILPKVRTGGFIIFDNVLWGGKILEAPQQMDKDTYNMFKLNKEILEDERVLNLMLPIRDGLMICKKR